MRTLLVWVMYVAALSPPLCIFVTFVLLGPMPPLTDLLGNILPLTVTALAIQGIGSAATYIGSLLFMLKGVSEAGLPDNEQTRGVSINMYKKELPFVPHTMK